MRWIETKIRKDKASREYYSGRHMLRNIYASVNLTLTFDHPAVNHRWGPEEAHGRVPQKTTLPQNWRSRISETTCSTFSLYLLLI